MAFIIIGVIAVILVPILFAIRSSQAKKLYQMQSVETSTVAQLQETRSAVPGSFVQRAEVKGVSECDSPLKAEFSETECVAYRIKLEREYEERRWETDSNGNREERINRGYETVSTNERRAPFYLRDSTGRIKVVPDGADLVMERSLSDYQSGLPGGSFSLGSFALDIASIALGGKQTLGYRYEEWIVPLNRDLYVLGEACDDGGELKIRRSSTKGEKYIISVKSEEELVSSAAGAVKGLLIGAIVSGAVGLVLLIIGILSRR